MDASQPQVVPNVRLDPSPPQIVPNGLSIVKGEMILVVSAIRTSGRWAGHTYHVSGLLNNLCSVLYDIKMY